jgi:hypothetical protein
MAVSKELDRGFMACMIAMRKFRNFSNARGAEFSNVAEKMLQDRLARILNEVEVAMAERFLRSKSVLPSEELFRILDIAEDAINEVVQHGIYEFPLHPATKE